MQAQATADYRTAQLSLNFSDGFFVPAPHRQARQLKRTITFPKHVTIPHFGAFQRQVNALFAPFGITVEFSLSRQKRLQMTWVFPPEPVLARTANDMAQKAMPPGVLSEEEVSAFTNVVFAFAGQPQNR
jgi:hypothetical protein